MLNFKESVAKVKSAPNFGKIATIGIQTSKNHKCSFFFILFFCFSGVYTGRGIYPRRMRNTPEGKNI